MQLSRETRGRVWLCTKSLRLQDDFCCGRRQRSRGVRIQGRLAELDRHIRLRSEYRPAYALGTFRMADSAPDADAQRRRICQPRMGDLLRPGREDFQEAQQLGALSGGLSTDFG